MAKRVNLRIFENTQDDNWEQIEELEFGAFTELKYGENPQQKAEFFKSPQMIDYEVLDEKELSYNEIINLTEVTNIISEFYDVPAAVIVVD